MKTFLDTLLTIAVLGGILVVSAVITNFYVRAMYNRCSGCAALNAKRRSHCRVCQLPLRVDQFATGGNNR
jgi:hypothetical protein